jgi:hypothetical protein
MPIRSVLDSRCQVVCPRFPDPTDHTVNQALDVAGLAGIGAPSCYHMPNPPLPKLPDKPRSTVVVLLDGVVTPEGTIEAPQAVRGVSGGPNDLATKTMLTWRCQPALKDNQPVATVVQFEISF